MSVAVATAVLAVGCARAWLGVEARPERIEARLVALLLGTITALSLAAAVCVAAAALGQLRSSSVSLALAGLALASFFVGRVSRDATRDEAAPSAGRRETWVWGLLVLGAIVLRWPPVPSVLGGQDPGSYELRTRAALRSGGMILEDPLLREASEILAGADEPSEAARVAARDLLGVYPRESGPARDDAYEAAYRPGFYVGDLERGRIVPQFFAGYPGLLAWSGLVWGPEALHRINGLASSLALLAFALALRRRFSREALGWGAAAWAFALVAFSPLVIWTQRQSLSEVFFALLLAGSWLASLGPMTTESSASRRRWQFVALCLGVATWVRGDAWIWGPCLAALAWWRPPSLRGALDPGRLYLLLLAGGIAFHAHFAYPYVHDEILRRVPQLVDVGPDTLMGAAGLGLVAWLLVDIFVAKRLASRRDTHAGPLARLIGLGLVLVLVVHLAAWRFGADEGAGRLDPLLPGLGWPTFVGLVALGLWSMRARFELRAAELPLWIILVVLVALYSQRALPNAHLFYYGRYLVPLVIPMAAVLVAVQLSRWTRTRPALRGLAMLATLGGVAWPLAWGTAWPEREREGVAEALDWLAAELPEGSIVLAGGEGWHRGFTDHQVGTALAMGYGHTVFPMRDREAAVAVLDALLVGGLAKDRAVYLLINEASHHYTREDDGKIVAGADLGLPPPFVATHARGFELWSHRHTPSVGAIPLRRTRDGMRMVLARVEVDAARASTIRTWFADAADEDGIYLARPDPANACLSPKKDLVLDLRELVDGPSELTLVLDPRDAPHNPKVRVKIDDQKRAVTIPGTRQRPRATLGPFQLSAGHGERLTLRGFPERGGGPCPHGRLVGVRVAPSPTWLRRQPEIQAHSFAPADDRGEPFKHSAWVPARAWSRFRPAFGRDREIADMSVRLRPGKPLRFDEGFLPGGAGRFDWIVTLTRAQLSADARLELRLDGELAQTIDPPDARERSWQSPKLRWTSHGADVQIEVRLVGAAEEDFVDLRDLAAFRVMPASPPTLHPERTP